MEAVLLKRRFLRLERTWWGNKGAQMGALQDLHLRWRKFRAYQSPMARYYYELSPVFHQNNPNLAISYPICLEFSEIY